ncbi:DUF885 domain-containing protein [Amycolatopsis sp. NPDC005003]
MTADQVVRGYLRLGLRLGRLVEGFVDCWFGDPALAAQVAAEPVPVPAELAADARELRRRLHDSELGEPRATFLDAQLRALACVADRLAGRELSFPAEIEAYFGVRIELADPDVYLAAHDEIRQVLPGPGSPAARLAAFHERDRMPAALLEPAAAALAGQLRDAFRDRFTLAEADEVRFEAVTDRPWNAFNRYHGGFHSTISLNTDAGHGCSALPHLVTHEAYPGHHADHCVKEQLLVRDRGETEHTLSLVNTPQCLVAEGIGERALAAAYPDGWGRPVAAVLDRFGPAFDGDLAERLLPVTARLLPARQDAALLLHDRHTDAEDVVAFLRRTMLVTEARARHMVRFLQDPLWRAYTVTYIEGSRLVGAWLAARDPGESVADRFARLLREPLLPAQLAAEAAG